MEKRQFIAPVHADPEVGLNEQQVQSRTEALWVGQSHQAAGRTEKEIILGHCFTFFNLIFIVLAGLLIFARSSVLNMTFLGVVVVNTVLGIVQEIRAKRAVDRLALMAEHPVTVIRDGKKQQIPPAQIVRDDIAEFTQGDQICADGILRSGQLWVDESLLTGESDSVEKQPGDTVHSGSIVLSGRGLCELTAVGDDCGAAAIAREAKSNPKAGKSEMMRSLDRLILCVGLTLVPVGGILFYQEYAVLQLGLQKSAEGTVAALVGMIPEGLYLLTSIALAVAARKLSRDKVLVQDRNCVEALARVDVLCVDKTGTITEPDMIVQGVYPLAQLPEDRLTAILTAMYGAVESDNATAQAIARHFSGRTKWVCENTIPFSPETKWYGCTFRGEGSFVVGAPEIILGQRMEELRETVTGYADQGRRVLLAAEYDGGLAKGTLEPEKVTPLALITLGSQLRPNAAETFAYFAQQGVDIRVISGDNPATASHIAQQAGIPGAESYIDASSLKTDDDFRKAVKQYHVFGRVTPEQKRKLIAALQRHGHTVAMTGDGVNDLLAMKQADCSIAMASGAQAASQLASLVLLDSDFSAMPGVVAEGRRVINNIQRAATLFLVKNIFSLFLSIITLFTAWPYPLEPIHLSVISALTIGVPSFLLTFEPRYDRIAGTFLPGVLRRALPGGLSCVSVVLLCQAFMVTFALPAANIATVCAAILAVVGLLVLFQVCKPFNLFRGGIWAAMAAGLIVCFTLFGDLFRLTTGGTQIRLVMLTLLLMTPTVFFAWKALFDGIEAVLRAIGRFFRRMGQGIKQFWQKLIHRGKRQNHADL